MTCPICTDELVNLDAIQTSCGHDYHRVCLARWFREGKECPMCRGPLPEMPTFTLAQGRKISKTHMYRADLLLLCALLEETLDIKLVEIKQYKDELQRREDELKKRQNHAAKKRQKKKTKKARLNKQRAAIKIVKT
jgi:hypothetical protein